jgi:hypothetical protein
MHFVIGELDGLLGLAFPFFAAAGASVIISNVAPATPATAIEHIAPT